MTSTIATDFIKGAPVGTTISATSRITHADDRLVTINIEVRDLDNDILVAKATAAMIVVDTFAGIPENGNKSREYYSVVVSLQLNIAVWALAEGNFVRVYSLL